jgi:hypothetical protein
VVCSFMTFCASRPRPGHARVSQLHEFKHAGPCAKHAKFSSDDFLDGVDLPNRSTVDVIRYLELRSGTA